MKLSQRPLTVFATDRQTDHNRPQSHTVRALFLGIMTSSDHLTVPYGQSNKYVQKQILDMGLTVS